MDIIVCSEMLMVCKVFDANVNGARNVHRHLQHLLLSMIILPKTWIESSSLSSSSSSSSSLSCANDQKNKMQKHDDATEKRWVFYGSSPLLHALFVMAGIWYMHCKTANNCFIGGMIVIN